MNTVETCRVRATVFVVIPEYHQAKARSADGHRQLTITRHTAGVLLDEVQEGQVYLLTVTRRPSRVLHANLIGITESE